MSMSTFNTTPLQIVYAQHNTSYVKYPKKKMSNSNELYNAIYKLDFWVLPKLFIFFSTEKPSYLTTFSHLTHV